jgi:guanylate kinase
MNAIAQSRPLVILTAPSGAGKTTIARALSERLPILCVSVSATTRAPRPGEIEGRDYYFLSCEEFERNIAAGAFLEYEMVYAGKYYGTLHRELERIWQRQQCPLRVVDVVGATALKKQFGKRALSIFIRPPSLQELEKRLEQRGTETAVTLSERVKKAEKELAFASRFDHTVVNDSLPHALDQIVSLIQDFLSAPGAAT